MAEVSSFIRNGDIRQRHSELAAREIHQLKPAVLQSCGTKKQLGAATNKAGSASLPTKNRRLERWQQALTYGSNNTPFVASCYFGSGCYNLDLNRTRPRQSIQTNSPHQLLLPSTPGRLTHTPSGTELQAHIYTTHKAQHAGPAGKWGTAEETCGARPTPAAVGNFGKCPS